MRSALKLIFSNGKFKRKFSNFCQTFPAKVASKASRIQISSEKIFRNAKSVWENFLHCLAN